MSSSSPFRVVFVCTGNICRSPMAEVVFRSMANDAGVGNLVSVTSAGTGDWHVGEQADHRALDALGRSGLDGTRHRARQFTPADFEHNDLIIALDAGHDRALREWATNETDADKIALLLSFDAAFNTTEQRDVPDPYYDSAEQFDEVLRMIQSACEQLFRQLRPALRGA